MRNLLLLLTLAFSGTLFAQLNATLRGTLDYNDGVNDIWGYAAPDGTEYAIVGLETGVSFVSLADPDNPVEVARVNGDQSIWRDMKTYGEYAYSVADQGVEGITAFDLRNLPDTVIFNRTTYQVPGFTRTFSRAHNIYIDTEKGVAYTAGGTRTIIDGGILMFDLKQDPMSPTLIGVGPSVYSHDVFTKGDTMYCSQIFRGDLAIYDISDYDNIVELGSTFTPSTFTHNAWTTEDAQTIFTTDERANAPVAAYDISDKGDIQLLDEFRPLASLNSGVIPHNVHVIDDYLSISYYTDGLVVADASKPDNIIEVANWDTWPGADGDFNGAWGATPFLPSGLTLVSDRSTGLYVVDINYVRAARLEGLITDALTGAPLNNVEVTIDAGQANFDQSDALGRYATGLAAGGTYNVTFTAENYAPLTVSVDLTNDVCVRLDTSLTSTAPRFNVGLTIIDDDTEEIISDATFVLLDDNGDFISSQSDNEGKVSLLGIFEDTYDMYITEWGYQTEARFTVNTSTLADDVIRLKRGYMDDFVTDENWVLFREAARGNWERGFPIGTQNGPEPFAPGTDAPGDIGSQSYFTGNDLTGGGAGTNDIDNGTTSLVSPIFRALPGQDSLVVNYQYWFANGSGNIPLDDTMTIRITNGMDTVVVRQYADDGVREWRKDSFLIPEFIQETATLQLIVEAGDEGGGHLVEAAFDNFFVTGREIPVSAENVLVDNISVDVFPNPSSDVFTMQFELGNLTGLSLRITDASGRQVQHQRLGASSGTIRFGERLAKGFYFVEVLAGGQRAYVTKVIKH